MPEHATPTGPDRPAPDRLVAGLEAWIIQDGNYGDFSRGDHASFALEFHAPDGLESVEPGSAAGCSLTHAGDARYEATGRIVHIAADWWAVDFGVLAYREEAPPDAARRGGWVRGQVHLGVDPFFYVERLAHEPDAPALIYDWTIEKIEMQTAPFIAVGSRVKKRDPARLGWKEIDKTDAWNDYGGVAEYLLHCRRRDGHTRRTRGR